MLEMACLLRQGGEMSELVAVRHEAETVSYRLWRQLDRAQKGELGPLEVPFY